MRRCETVAWCIMAITSAAIGIAFMVHTYPLGIFAALVVFSISLVIAAIGIDQEVRSSIDE